MKTVYQDESNVVLEENSVEWKPCINSKSKSLEIRIKLYSCHDTKMKFLVVVTPPSIYHNLNTPPLLSFHFHPMITSQNFINRSPCRYFVNKSAIMWSVLKYEIDMFFAFTPVFSKKIMYINVPRVPSAWLLPNFSSLLHYDYPGTKCSA